MPDLPAWDEHQSVHERQRHEVQHRLGRRLLRRELRRVRADPDEGRPQRLRQLRYRSGDLRERVVATRDLRRPGVHARYEPALQQLREGAVLRELHVGRMFVPADAGLHSR